MNIEIKVIRGHWTVNGNRLSEMNYTEQKFLGEFFQYIREQSNLRIK